MFFRHHQCNALCRALGLRDSAACLKEIAEMAELPGGEAEVEAKLGKLDTE